MLALFDKSLRPPNSLCSFATLYSEQPLLPLAFQTSSEEEVSNRLFTIITLSLQVSCVRYLIN